MVFYSYEDMIFCCRPIPWLYLVRWVHFYLKMFPHLIHFHKMGNNDSVTVFLEKIRVKQRGSQPLCSLCLTEKNTMFCSNMPILLQIDHHECFYHVFKCLFIILHIGRFRRQWWSFTIPHILYTFKHTKGYTCFRKKQQKIAFRLLMPFLSYDLVENFNFPGAVFTTELRFQHPVIIIHVL